MTLGKSLFFWLSGLTVSEALLPAITAKQTAASPRGISWGLPTGRQTLRTEVSGPSVQLSLALVVTGWLLKTDFTPQSRAGGHTWGLCTALLM